LNLPPADREKVFWRNAAKLLKLPLEHAKAA
jgi:predicted TIM-barrel fold metal-dependent hydrolase